MTIDDPLELMVSLADQQLAARLGLASIDGDVMTDDNTSPPGDDVPDFVNAMIHHEIEALAGRSTFPIVDCERAETTYELIQDFGLIEVQHEPTDEFRALPVRLTHGASGFQIELGDYNLGDREIDVLRRAVEAYLRLQGSGASR